jgi:uncharacterized protein with HEPN domain
MRDDTVYLKYILECIGRIEENSRGGYEHFMASHTIQDAILRNLQVIAESTQRISDSMKTTSPDIEWRQIAAFRNILVHDYLGIDLDAIWIVVVQDIPALRQAIQSMLPLP